VGVPPCGETKVKISCTWGCDFGVAAKGSSAARIAVVQEVDIQAICVMGCADWRDGRESGLGFPPTPSSHAPAVVNEEDGVKLAEKRVW
jgi:hypothetical protein